MTRCCAGLLCWLVVLSAAADPLDELLQQVQQGRALDAEENAARLQAFQTRQAQQAELLKEARAAHATAEARAAQLEQQFETNEAQLTEVEALLRIRLGELQDLNGVLLQTAGDARGRFEESMTHLQFPERNDFLDEFIERMSQKMHPASLADMERLWFELQRELIEAGRVVRIAVPVTAISGGVQERSVVRIGVFNLVADGKYLEYVPETGRVVEPPRQPGRHFLDRVVALEEAGEHWVAFALDPSRGHLLNLLIQKLGWREQVEQGGVIGYAIIALGLLALLMALERLLVLAITGMRMRRQLLHPERSGNNPLGRVLQVYHDHPEAAVEALELRLTEAILREQGGLQSRLAILKLIAIVAPLMGLLGTVTGMIITFQSIVLFGTGDPTLMAGGISQALITTVMGLCVAIPILLLHTMAASRARRLTQLLEEQATGMVATQAEQQRGMTATQE